VNIGPRLQTATRVGVALLVGLGGGYLLRGGSDEDTPAPVAATTTVLAASEERQDVVLAATPAEAPRAVQRGGTATIEFQARPGSSCQVELQPEGGIHLGERLPVQVADETGKVTWRWVIDEDIPEGTAHAVVVCSGGARGQAAIRVV
jgi:hypothetical protein